MYTYLIIQSWHWKIYRFIDALILQDQILLAFWAPKLKITQLLLTFTMLQTFLSKCRIFTYSTAIYPVITNGTFFKKRFKRLKRKVCIFISLPKKLIPKTYTFLITLIATLYACECEGVCYGLSFIQIYVLCLLSQYISEYREWSK